MMIARTTLVACLAAFLLALGTTSAPQAHSPGTTCAHEHQHRTGDLQKLSKRAWRKAHGPGKKQTRRYQHVRRCAPHPHNVKSYWRKAMKRYAATRERKRLWVKCGNSPTTAVDACIDYAAIYKGADGGWMHRVAYCESRKNPRASNGSHHGLFQYAPSTWATTPYGDKSIWSARWQSLATAWMLRQGRAGEWACG